MKKIKAFTLIELIIVISIIAIMGFSSVVFFKENLEKKDINKKITFINNLINDLNKEVYGFEIFDYELVLDINNSNKIIIYKNIIDSNIKQKINSISGDNLTISNNGTGTGFIKIYKGHKLFKTSSFTGSEDFPLFMGNNSKFKIKSSLSSTELNQIEINYLSEENTTNDGVNNKTYLFKITDQNGNQYTKVSIKNISNKITFYENSNKINSDFLDLYLEINGKEQTLRINKY